MKAPKLASLLKDKKLRYGGYSTLVTAIVIGLVLAVNVVVDQIPAKLDMTQRGFYSLSDQSRKILDGLKADVNIYEFAQTGKENKMLQELVFKYTNRSHKVTFKAVDPVRNPGFAKKYEKEGSAVGENSLVVASGTRFKVLSQFDLYNFSYDQESQTQQVQSQQFEAQITSAILYCTTDDLPVVGTLTMHDESDLPYELRKQLELENYTLESVNLVTSKSVPDNVDLLVVNGPQRDLTADDVAALRSYLEKGGRMILQVGLLQKELKGWNELLASYGLAVRNKLVVEQNAQRHYAQMPVFLIPELEVHDILSPLRSADMIVLMPFSVYIEQLELKKRTTEIESLLVTSDSAFAKSNLESEKTSFEPGDVNGPLHLAVAASDRLDDQGTKYTRIVVVGNASYLDGELTSAYPGNQNFFLNALSWMEEREDTLSIRSKPLVTMRLFMNQFVSLLLSGVVVILIPLVAFGIGLTVWLRRRHL
jgi:ABC-2 type transport system permease protein